MYRTRTHRNHTFTLIEMLIVVVIIGLLAAALIPRLTGAQERSRDSAREVKIKDISNAVELYAQDNWGKYPIAPFAVASWTIPSTVEAIGSGFIWQYLTQIPTDPGKGVFTDSAAGECKLWGDSFAYYTDPAWKMFAITAISESKRGNTTACKGLIDADNNGAFQVMGQGLTYAVAGGGWSSYPTTAWVHYVWNDIVVSDGTNRYIIADRNVWATAAGTGQASYGSFFQRGNNYGFSTVGTVSPDNQWAVDTSAYNWSNPYNDSTFRWDSNRFSATRGDWSSNQNDNLRPEKAQWPCPTWYHIPAYAEWKWLINTRASLTGKTTSKSDGYAQFNNHIFSSDLKLPIAGLRSFNSVSSVNSQGVYGNYWSSTPNYADAYFLNFDSSRVLANYTDYRAYGFSVRCFQNSY